MERDGKIDSIKAVLILLVVLGHCIEATSNEGVMRFLYNTIYSFHMPLFIFFSGYFTNVAKNKSDYLTSVLNILLIYMIFQILHTFIGVDHRSLFSYIIMPHWTLWFLLSTACWKILFYIICSPKMLSVKINNWFLLSMLLISLSSGFLPVGGQLSIQRTLYFSFAFALGMYFRTNHPLNNTFNIPDAIKYASGIVIVVALLMFKDNNINQFLYGSSPYISWNINLAYCPFIRLILIIVSIAFSIMVVNYCPQNKYLCVLGQNTLFIYAYHSFVIKFLKYLHIDIPDIILLMVCLFITSAFLYLLYQVKIFRTLINPVKLIKR